MGYSQTDSILVNDININSYLIDNDLGQGISKYNFHSDSIQVTAQRFSLKIQAQCEFPNCSNRLSIDFYFNKSELTLIRCIEKNPKYKEYDNAQKISEFFYNKGKLLDENRRIGIPAVFAEIGLSENIEKAFGYNQDLTLDFLKTLAFEIIQRTKD